MKIQPKLLLAVLLGLFMGSALAQEQDAAIGQYDELATENVKSLTSTYIGRMAKLFNDSVSENAAEAAMYAFTDLFDEAAFIVQDYTTGKDYRNPSEYYHSAKRWFEKKENVYTGEVDWESIALNYFESDDYYIATINVSNNYRYIYNSEFLQLEEGDHKIPVRLEMKIDRASRNSKIIMVDIFEPPVALQEEEEKKEKEPKPKKEKQPKPEKEPKATPTLLFASVGYGSDLGLSNFSSESSNFTVEDYSNSSVDLSLSLMVPISENGFYVGGGIGLLSGKLDIEYESSVYSFAAEFSDNTLTDPVPGATAVTSGSYTRFVNVTDLKESIKYSDFTIHALVGKNLLQPGTNKFFMIAGGLSLGFPVVEESTLSGRTSYYGRFTEINGFPTDVTIGLNEDVPEFGFERSDNEFTFEYDSALRFNGLIRLNGGLTFGDIFYAGIGLDFLIPFNNWLEGEQNHETLFETKSDLDDSLANTVISASRPIRLGASIQLGITF